jgi:signal peptidase I
MGEKSQIKELLDWIMHIAVAVLAGLLIVTFVAQRTIVFNYSMEPTLYQGDNLIVEKLGPRLGRLKSGDIVTIKDASDFLSEEGKTIIKRIIAVENDIVEIKEGNVYVNGKRLNESYINGDTTKTVRKEYSDYFKIPEGHVYVLGDNRAANIIDSRSIGAIAVEKVQGRAVFRIYPFDRIGILNR